MNASDLVEEAIKASVAEQDWSGLVTGWVVLVTFADHDGERGHSGIGWLLPNGEMPWPALLGTVEAARTKLHHDFLQE